MLISTLFFFRRNVNRQSQQDGDGSSSSAIRDIGEREREQHCDEREKRMVDKQQQ